MDTYFTKVNNERRAYVLFSFLHSCLEEREL